MRDVITFRKNAHLSTVQGAGVLQANGVAKFKAVEMETFFNYLVKIAHRVFIRHGFRLALPLDA
jgi:hypothetical protein